jgi:hypothetical protein
MGSGMENPDLPLPPIYRRIFHVPKGGGKSGFYCVCKNEVKIVEIPRLTSYYFLQIFSLLVAYCNSTCKFSILNANRIHFKCKS